MNYIKLMVCGHGRHGKDTFSELLGLKFKSSSEVALEEVVFPQWGKDHYATEKECFEDRHNHRAKWHKLISDFCTPDKTKLGKLILSDNDIYCGIRCADEFLALKKEDVFHFSIWVDGSERHPPEPSDSCTITPDLCDMVVTNNGSLKDLAEKASLVMTIISLLSSMVDITQTVVENLINMENENEKSDND